jgi:hypothetical protein
MKLRKRQKRKTAQALDAAAGITKLWSEWQVGKKASKGVAKVKKSGVKGALSSKPARFAGLAALLGGAGAAVAKKLKGGPDETYTTSDGDKVSAPDVAPPLAIAPDPPTATDATMPQGAREPAVGASALRPSDGGGEASAPDASSAGGADVASGDPASPSRPSPTVGGVEPAVPSDEPVVEPSTLSAEPEPIADERGGDGPGDGEPVAETADLGADSAAVADED